MLTKYTMRSVFCLNSSTISENLNNEKNVCGLLLNMKFVAKDFDLLQDFILL